MDQGSARQRFRHHAPVPREGARFQQGLRRLRRALRACRRSVDRQPGRGHDRRHCAGAVRRAAFRAGTDRARHRRAAGRRRCLPARGIPRAAAARLRLRGDQALRLRLRAREARQDAPSVLHQVLIRRRAHHHAGQGERFRRRPVLHHARGRPRALRAGRGRRSRRDAARVRHLHGGARKPVATVGERRGSQPRFLAAFLSAVVRRLPGALPQSAAGDLLSRHQQGRALADPHRRRRGDLQSSRHAALRSGAGPAGGPAQGQGPAGGMARALPGRFRS